MYYYAYEYAYYALMYVYLMYLFGYGESDYDFYYGYGNYMGVYDESYYSCPYYYSVAYFTWYYNDWSASVYYYNVEGYFYMMGDDADEYGVGFFYYLGYGVEINYNGWYDYGFDIDMYVAVSAGYNMDSSDYSYWMYESTSYSGACVYEESYIWFGVEYDYVFYESNDMDADEWLVDWAYPWLY